jgi:hypothetical protein
MIFPIECTDKYICVSINGKSFMFNFQWKYQSFTRIIHCQAMPKHKEKKTISALRWEEVVSWKKGLE